MTVGNALKASWSMMLSLHGYPLTFRREIQGVYDASTGVVATSNSDETVRGFFSDSKRNQDDGSRVERGERMLYMDTKQTDGSALTKTPKTGDLIFEDSEDDLVSITMVRKIRSGATVIGYMCKVSE